MLVITEGSKKIQPWGLFVRVNLLVHKCWTQETLSSDQVELDACRREERQSNTRILFAGRPCIAWHLCAFAHFAFSDDGTMDADPGLWKRTLSRSTITFVLLPTLPHLVFSWSLIASPSASLLTTIFHNIRHNSAGLCGGMSLVLHK